MRIPKNLHGYSCWLNFPPISGPSRSGKICVNPNFASSGFGANISTIALLNAKIEDSHSGLSLKTFLTPCPDRFLENFLLSTSMDDRIELESRPTEIPQVSENGDHSCEIKEPSANIEKLVQNGFSEDMPLEETYLFRVKKLSEKAILPSRGSPLSAGYDLSSATDTTVTARSKALIPTDLSIAIPEGTYARVAPRSGLALKHSIDVGGGVIDADYRGPVGVILFNHSDVDFRVKTGDRIAQLIIEKIVTPEVIEVHDLDATVRGTGGFGSTGI